MKRYRVLLISLFLLLLATGLYGENDDQPKWSTTIFGAFALSNDIYFGIGGTIGYSFISRLELEVEVYSIFWEYKRHGLSGAVLYNFDGDKNKTVYYVLGGFSQLRGEWDIDNYLMFGGGIKKYIAKRLKIRFDIRINMAENVWTKFYTGLMWSF